MLQFGFRAERQRHRGERTTVRFVLRLELVEAVERVVHGEYGMTHVPAHRAGADFHVDEEKCRVLGVELLQRVRRRRTASR